jgi:cytoskeletal protein RodZ
MQATRFWPIAVVSVGVAAGVVLAVALTRQRPAPERRSGVANVVGTSGSAAAADAVAAPKSTDAVAPAVPNTGSVTAAPDATAGVTVVLTATSPSWVTANADGRRAIFRTVTPGSPETVIAKREIVMRVGNAGALAWRINGRDAGPMGRQGQVRDVTITPATAGTIR